MAVDTKQMIGELIVFQMVLGDAAGEGGGTGEDAWPHDD